MNGTCSVWESLQHGSGGEYCGGGDMDGGTCGGGDMDGGDMDGGEMSSGDMGGMDMGCGEGGRKLQRSSSTGVSAIAPRYHQYVPEIPVAPSISASPHSPSSSYLPIGIAVNGVLVTGNHDTGPALTCDFDSCGGHSDTLNRYHYHSPLICVLEMMGLPVPATRTAFLHDSDPDLSVSRWPSKSLPSPVLGLALDGDLVRANDLDECSFDANTNSYHCTSDFPFGPTCLVGDTAGSSSFEDIFFSSSEAELCLKQGIDNVYCTGPSCVPSHYEPCSN